MQQLHPDLWVVQTPLRFLGLEINTRMTVIRLPGPKLLLHSPIAATPELVREVTALGPVAFLIAPNRFHHLFIDDWKQACPEARIYVAPGLDSKRPDLSIAGVLRDEPHPEWSDVLDQVALGGLPLVNETVFFHRPSATLIATDLAANIGPTSPPLTRLTFRMVGCYGRLSPTPVERLLVRDRAAFCQSMQRMLAWPFERIIVAHGEVCETGGREALLRGYDWVLRGRNDALSVEQLPAPS